MAQLPTINSLEQLLPNLKLWQQTINPTLNLPTVPRSPFNFRASGGAVGSTGVALSWEVVKGADGYEIQSSTNGDFSTAPVIATLTTNLAMSWFDSTVITSVKRWYRIRSTNGTTRAPHYLKGIWSAPIIATSGSNTTTYDQTSGPRRLVISL
jgi:hypothetical protein